jgi:hypothetical protein
MTTSFQFTFTNLQFTFNDSMINVSNSAAMLLPQMKIENCTLKINSEGVF